MTARRVAVITGAASGIGRACTELFLARNYCVLAVDVSAASFDWLDHPNAASFPGDVSDDWTNEVMVAETVQRWGRLDVAVLNAGITGGMPFEADGALDRLDRILAVNVRGVASGIRHAVPAMRASGDHPAVVVTASTSGLRGDPRNWAYNASKAAVINLVRGAAMDYGSQGIRLNCVAPGPTDTGMTARLRDAPEMWAAMARRIPLQRWGQAGELAEAVYFLASPAASFIHGVVLPVDGGISAAAGHFDLPERTTDD
jgi:meso-butanediol dehydrogenase / (S,S)-butanediol dehydrogenase / diacetyl reductase